MYSLPVTIYPFDERLLIKYLLDKWTSDSFVRMK